MKKKILSSLALTVLFFALCLSSRQVYAVNPTFSGSIKVECVGSYLKLTLSFGSVPSSNLRTFSGVMLHLSDTDHLKTIVTDTLNQELKDLGYTDSVALAGGAIYVAIREPLDTINDYYSTPRKQVSFLTIYILNTGTPNDTVDVEWDTAGISFICCCINKGMFSNKLETPLPLNLVSFSGEETGTWNQLFWKTATEENTQRFIIERSRDGVNFEQIGEVLATGTSRYPVSYSYVDQNTIGSFFYQLKIEDIDGTVTYSEIIAVKDRGESEFSFYPNPTSEGIYVETTKALTLTLSSISNTGTIVFSKNITSNCYVELNTLVPGTYILEAHGDNTNIRTKFIKR